MMFPLVGNSKVAASINAAISEKRIPHAIIIEGDAGTGKRTFAKFIAKSALCENDNAPCGMCKNCTLLENNSHPDISYIRPEESKKNISVDQVRLLRKDAFIKPHISSKRVFIIEKAQTLNEQAQNALLKILEEPPSSVIFILVCENKSAFLNTITSRCVAFHLTTPSKEEAAEYILGVTKADTEEINDSLAKTGNNIGKALTLLKGKNDNKLENAASLFLDYMQKGDAWNMLLCVKPFEKNRNDAAEFIFVLKKMVFENIKANKNAKAMLEFFESLTELEKSLITNINLNLFFASVTLEAEKIISKH